jgi:hypothetical protein
MKNTSLVRVALFGLPGQLTDLSAVSDLMGLVDHSGLVTWRGHTGHSGLSELKGLVNHTGLVTWRGFSQVI